jgi:hypothetical protein
MRKISPLLVLTAIFGLMTASNAQEECPGGAAFLSPLSIHEEIQLQCLPELKLPPGYGNRELPYMVDNSTQIYMRPAYNQDGLCCGQASAIGYNFTYEMSRERDLNASLVENQYPTHFSWNFMNGGEGYYGVSYLHSLQILKEYGMPDVIDYGGTLSYGGPSRWMSGYTEYYNGMHNRITNAYQIQGGTPEGLLVIKHWLHSHLDSSDVGGIASFYAQYMAASQTLPPGTPEAGKYVLTTFGGSPNHAMTIVGYNDSIRWDYNSDGQYTNNMDINGDDVVDMKDWEIGGFKMVQSYGGVPNWGNQGYAYMMYKTIADNLGNGGIWNHCVHVLDVKETCDPKMTAKIVLKHNRRDVIKVLAGISNDTGLDRPQVILGYPIYDYQGGNHYMQGGSTEADKTIEFGLDLSKLLSDIMLNQEIKIFLQVVEDDPFNAYTGEIIYFSIFDYTSGWNEIVCPQTNVPLAGNDTTTLFVTHTFNFSRVEIIDETIPPAPAGEYYSHQLTVTGGAPPYIWEFDKTYGESSQVASFPMITTNQLTPSGSTSGMVTQALDFEFPYYDSSYSSITVHVDGYLMFDEQLYPFPYYQDDKVLFNITRNISPFLNQHQEISTSQGCGIWYEGDDQSATFRWKTILSEFPSQQMNYAVKLYPDGTIKFYYGSMNGCAEFLWIAGISDGDNFNYQATAISDKPVITANTSIILQPYDYPEEMALSDNGLFYGTPGQPYGNEQITFRVTDNNFIHTTKSFILTSSGVIVFDSVSSGGDEVIAFGENVLMSISVMNARSEIIPDAVMTIHINDPFITVSDSTENLGNIDPGTTNNYPDAFNFTVAQNVPNDHLITIQTVINSDTNTWESSLFHHAYAPGVSVAGVEVSDENGRLDAGDTTDLTISFMNEGGVGVTNLFATLMTEDPYIDLNLNSGYMILLDAGQTLDVTYNLSVSGTCPPGHSVDFIMHIAGDGDYLVNDTFNLVVGLYREDFETGDMDLFTWGSDGKKGWKIDTYAPYEGTYSARSGIISHDQESVMKVDMEVLSDGEISFYQHTSCENDTSAANNYDYLSFRIDGTEMGRWDGETAWSMEQFPVTAGFHRFEWAYHKDDNVSYRMDAAWIDFIAFPSAICTSPVLSVTPASVDIALLPGTSATQKLMLTNPAEGNLNFTADLSGIEPLPLEDLQAGRNIEGSYMTGNMDKFHTGQDYSWNFLTYNAGSDNEWIKQVYIDFPEGIDLTAATDFVGGSGGPMVFEGQTGNGVTAHWFGEDANGWGVVHMGESAVSDISVSTLENTDGNLAISYQVMGEVYGGTPHEVYGEIPLRNLGPVTPWLDIDSYAGNLPGGDIDSLTLSVNTEGLADGEYHGWILLQDNFNHENIIPVNLTVDQYLDNPVIPGHENDLKIGIWPNPFRDRTVIGISLQEPSMIRIELLNSQGIPVTAMEMDPGNNKLARFGWDGSDMSGNPLPPGIYVLRARAGEFIGYARIIIIR